MNRTLLVLFAALALFARPALAQPALKCFDVALVAELGKTTPGDTPRPGGYAPWPWNVPLKVEQVLVGEEPRQNLTISVSLQEELLPKIRYAFVLLRREPDGVYRLSGWHLMVIKDDKGRFIVPVITPLGGEEPPRWLTSEFNDIVKPISYRATDAWWLTDVLVDLEERAAVAAGRATQKGDQVTALQGLYLEDLARHPTLQAHRCRH